MKPLFFGAHPEVNLWKWAKFVAIRGIKCYRCSLLFEVLFTAGVLHFILRFWVQVSMQPEL